MFGMGAFAPYLKNFFMCQFTETDCYDCLYFVKNGEYQCQKLPCPKFSDKPTADTGFRFLIPHEKDFFHPGGFASHCNSFVEKFKETLF